MEEQAILIPTGSAGSPSDASAFQVGDEVCLYGKVQSNDEGGITIVATKPLEKMESEEQPKAPDTAGSESDEAPAAGGESSTSSATEYVKKRRAEMV